MTQVPPELELAKVLRQVALRDVNVRAVDRAFDE